ncbi:hypothetical protein HK104_000302 [Borealophlyctis nickersoniae]|nr:hypothetical protein HK104_000302 [Borealophlyctis nickersoniae]
MSLSNPQKTGASWPQHSALPSAPPPLPPVSSATSQLHPAVRAHLQLQQLQRQMQQIQQLGSRGGLLLSPGSEGNGADNNGTSKHNRVWESQDGSEESEGVFGEGGAHLLRMDPQQTQQTHWGSEEATVAVQAAAAAVQAAAAAVAAANAAHQEQSQQSPHSARRPAETALREPDDAGGSSSSGAGGGGVDDAGTHKVEESRTSDVVQSERERTPTTGGERQGDILASIPFPPHPSASAKLPALSVPGLVAARLGLNGDLNAIAASSRAAGGLQYLLAAAGSSDILGRSPLPMHHPASNFFATFRAFQTPPTPPNGSPFPEDDSQSAASRRKRRPSKLYTCPFEGCGKQFTRNFNLQSHTKTHDPDRERPYVCDRCGKAFWRKVDLDRHDTVHTKVKGHGCPTCRKMFTRKDALQRHVSAKRCAGFDVGMSAEEGKGLLQMDGKSTGEA